MAVPLNQDLVMTIQTAHRLLCPPEKRNSPGWVMPVCLSIALLLGAGCPTSPPTEKAVPTDSPPADSQSATRSAEADIAPHLGSLPEFTLIDQQSERFGAAELQGQVAIVNFLYTACPSTCPQQTQQMAEIQKRLKAEGMPKGVTLLSISVDPETDTVEVLNDYAERNQVDANVWKFLTGEQETIWKLSRDGFELPVASNPDDPLNPITHDPHFVLVDRMGNIRGRFDVLGTEGIEPLWKALGHVLPEFAPDLTQWPRLQSVENVTHLSQPPENLDTRWLTELARLEQSTIAQTEVEHGFRFEEIRKRSGITFFPQIVDDQRWRLLVNHYDHGNSVSVADVDGDGKLDIYFVSQVGPNELWRNLGEGRFENFTEEAGVGLEDRISVAATFADADNDGDADLFVTSVRTGNAFLVNDGSGRFADQTKQAGLEYTGHSSTGTFFDYDRDGLLDLYLTNVGKYTTEEYALVRQDLCHSQPETEISYYVGRKDAFAGHLKPELSEPSRLYRNLGENRFEDVSEAVSLVDTSWSGDAIPIDVNQDGWLDLYILNMQGDDHLYVNQQGKSFEDQSARYFPQTPWGAMGATLLDYNLDGRQDLMITDMHSDMSEDIGPAREKLKSRMQWPVQFLQTTDSSIFGNAFFAQTSEGQFEEISDRINAENYWPWGLSAGDLNADGFEDLFLASSMCFPYRYGINSLLLNDRGAMFVDAHFTLGVEPRPAEEMLAPWFSLDASGADQENPIAENRSGTVVVWSARGSRSSVLFDFDDDGDLDIVTNEFNTPPLVLRSTLAQETTANFLQIELQGSESNRDGLGAVVTVETGQQVQSRVVNGKSGYLSQSRMPLYFGLGEATQVDRVTVKWPSGQVQELSGPLEANRRILVTEPSGQ